MPAYQNCTLKMMSPENERGKSMNIEKPNLENFFINLLENLHEYIYSVRYENGIPVHTFHSKSCKKITGYDAEEFASDESLWYRMIYEEDREEVKSFINTILESKGEGTIEHRIAHKSGVIRWVVNSMSVIQNETGNIQYLNGFVMDITQAKKNEDELRKLYRAVEQSPATVVITDRNGSIEYVNPKFVQLTGYSFSEAIGKNPRILKSGVQGTDFYKNLWETILSGQEWRGEFHNKKKNGELYWEFASISPIRDFKGHITNFIAVKEDITQRKLAEETLMKSEQKLRLRNEAMEKDLKLAQIIQRSFIPDKVPRVKGLNIDYRYEPLDKVGGDYFAFVDHGEDTYGVLQCDVAGHGVAAALFLSLVKSITDRISQSHWGNTEKYLDSLNRMLLQERQQFFITGVYAIFRMKQNTVNVEIANGGHPPQILYRAAKNSFELVKSSGTVVGMIESAVYRKENLSMQVGDRLFLFTDGIPEAENERKEMIGFEDKLIELFRKSHRINLSETLDAVLAGVREFADNKPLDDDILIIGIEATGS